jgi:hypothetical protein
VKLMVLLFLLDSMIIELAQTVALERGQPLVDNTAVLVWRHGWALVMLLQPLMRVIKLLV